MLSYECATCVVAMAATNGETATGELQDAKVADTTSIRQTPRTNRRDPTMSTRPGAGTLPSEVEWVEYRNELLAVVAEEDDVHDLLCFSYPSI